MAPSTKSPFQTYLEVLHDELKGLSSGEVASYIPELAKAAPDSFALSFSTIDGQIYSVGDSGTEFSIQSVSKPFAYGDALHRLGSDTLLRKVGVEPTGEAFNSIVLDQRKNRPFNPMVNAGAIAVSALADGQTAPERIAAMRSLFSRFAGRELTIDEDVYRSEADTGHRNRAIAYLMLNSGMFDRPPEEVLELYFRQCSLRVTVEDLARMGAVLANGGINPQTGERVIGPEAVRDVLTLMMTCGMYDYAGEWSYEVGLPAKSGVSGGIVAILPGQLSVAIWSPPLDDIGNSVRGIEACRRISRDFGLHMFMNSASVEDVVLRTASGDARQSLRIRNPRDQDILKDHGRLIALAELQGTLYFASAERMIRQLDELSSGRQYLVLDFRRLNSIDPAASRFFSDFIARMQTLGIVIIFADISSSRPQTAKVLSDLSEAHGLSIAASLDEALETCEELLLAGLREPFDFSIFALSRIALFDGFAPDELAAIEALIQPIQFSEGEKIITTGVEEDTMFMVARGTVSIWVTGGVHGDVRVGGMGPGQFFGEMAVLGDGLRSADVVADERVVCYGINGTQMQVLSRDHPAASAKIMANLAKEFAARLRQANALIRTLK